MPSSCSFCIVTEDDTPLYSKDFVTDVSKSESLNHFVLHASLDIMDHLIWSTPQMYVRCVDQFEEKLVYGMITATQLRFLLLYEGVLTRGDEVIKSFFYEVYEHFIAQQINPLYEPNSPITSSRFDLAVQDAAQRFLL
ncbi:hypothetical protein P9112_001636 [Eukaryota sp. TZLM1-RC]